MLADNVKREYQKIRRKNAGIHAHSALTWARANCVESPWDWSTDGETATREEAGFTITLKVKPDEFAEIDWVGEFTDTHEAGAILNNETHSNHAYKWFVPAISKEEHSRGLVALGYSKGVAAELAAGYVRADYRRALDLQCYAVLVTVERHGIELGSSSLWGIDVSDDWAEAIGYFEECANDCMAEAIEEARNAIAKLAEEAGDALSRS